MKGIKLYCQPAYNYDKNTIDYLEILVREYQGCESVYSVMQYIKNNNKEVSFDLAVLSETLRILNKHPKLDIPVGINLMPVTMEQAGISEKIVKIIHENNKNGNEIIIEINEDTDFSHKNVINNAKVFNDNNIKIALDDFGIDNANLMVLLMYKVDILKVDKKFIDTNNEDELEESQAAILKALRSIIRDLHIKHIVEGIESKKQLQEIKSLGYSVVQGYVYKIPIPFEKVIQDINKGD